VENEIETTTKQASKAKAKAKGGRTELQLKPFVAVWGSGSTQLKDAMKWMKDEIMKESRNQSGFPSL